jgi:myosin heavy subunit
MNDLTELPDEERLAETLSQRLTAGTIYTRAGPSLLISVNPYGPARLGPFPLYSKEVASLYRGGLPGFQPPHLFDVAERVRENLATSSTPQAILVSGESGSGKTEAIRVLLSSLAGSSPVASRLLASNLLLEAFGNAQTAKNANSSRFTKVLELRARGGGVESGAVRVMLLEAHRVVAQGLGERGFHVFHALLASPAAGAPALSLMPPPAGGWRFLGAPQAASDAPYFRSVEKVARDLGVTPAVMAGWWAALAACLHLGELELVPAEDGSGGAALGEGRSARALVALLGVSHDELSTALTTRALRIRGEAIAAARSAQGATAAAASLAKGIFRELFAAVAAICSGSGAVKGGGDAPPPPRAALLLDVFGFEVPAQANGFDALCINGANCKFPTRTTPAHQKPTPPKKQTLTLTLPSP